MKRLMIFAIALMMALGCAALGESESPVVYTVNGEEITLEEITHMAELLQANGVIETADDYLTAIEYVTYAHVYDMLFERYGLNEFTEEELAAFKTEAENTWEEALESYIAYFNTSENPTEEELAALRQQAEEYFIARGSSFESLEESLIQAACYDRLDSYLLELYGLEATEEDVWKALEEEVETEKQYFAEDVYSYEIYTQYYGYTMYYTPAGYRGVLQILLEVDEGLLDEYQSALAAAEEEGADKEAAEARITAAREAIMSSKQAVIDEIYARLDGGEKFIDLIPEYNIDPGMQQEEYLTNGYVVHRDSIRYDVPFVDAAFDENMLAVGDVSTPQIGRYGIYIVYYLRDIPEGMVEISDEEFESIRESLTNSALNDKISNELYPQWESECAIEYNEEALAALGIQVTDGVLSRIEQEPAAEEEAEAPAAE